MHGPTAWYGGSTIARADPASRHSRQRYSFAPGGTSWDEAADPEGGGCGAATRAAVVGLAYHADAHLRREAAFLQAFTTHGHPDAQAASIAVAEAVSLNCPCCRAHSLIGADPSSWRGSSSLYVRDPRRLKNSPAVLNSQDRCCLRMWTPASRSCARCIRLGARGRSHGPLPRCALPDRSGAAYMERDQSHGRRCREYWHDRGRRRWRAPRSRCTPWPMATRRRGCAAPGRVCSGAPPVIRIIFCAGRIREIWAS